MKVISLIIENYNNATFFFFINNHIKFIKTFDNMFNFLYYKYFSKITFESMYLSEYKIYIFMNFFKMIRFIKDIEELRSLIKHYKRVIH